jgi:uncharacterized membrane protein YheB (UPF0754 family)
MEEVRDENLSEEVSVKEDEKEVSGKKEEKEEDFLSTILGKENPISDIINNFIKEAKSIKTEDINDFTKELSEDAKKILETKLKKASEDSGVKNFTDLISEGIKASEDSGVKNFTDLLIKGMEKGEIKMQTFDDFLNNGKVDKEGILKGMGNLRCVPEPRVNELLQSYKNIQNQKRILKNQIANLSDEKRKEFWAKYYDIPTQDDVDKKINIINEKLEDLILESQIMRKKLGN